MTYENESGLNVLTPSSPQAWKGLIKASDRSSSLSASALGFSLLLLATDFEPDKSSLVTAWTLFATTIVLALVRSIFEGYGEPVDETVDIGPGYTHKSRHQNKRIAVFVTALSIFSIGSFVIGFFVFMSFLLNAL